MRRIIFTEAELVEALTQIMLQRGDQIPEGLTPVVILGRDMQNRPNVLLAYTHVQPSAEYSFSNQEVLAALVLYCMQSKVPLPRGAEKTLEIVDGFIAVSFKHGDEAELAQR